MDIFVSKKLKYFMVVMQKESLSKAAEALCITRSPLSKKINELEDLLGAPLFKRCGSGIAPTLLAREYYEKCKDTYNELCNIDNEILDKNKNKDISIIFDITFQQLLISHIHSIFDFERRILQIERRILLPEDIFHIKNSKNSIAISLREIPFTQDIMLEKWCSEGFSLVYPERYSPDELPVNIPIYIWRDKFAGYLKEAASKILKIHNEKITFIEHNFPLCSLMHFIKTERGCAVMPYKFAQTFKIEGVKVSKIPNNSPFVYIYHHAALPKTIINRIKSTLNTLI